MDYSLCINADQMKPNPECTLCSGSGEITIEQFIGGEYVDETIDCPECEARNEAENDVVKP